MPVMLLSFEAGVKVETLSVGWANKELGLLKFALWFN